MEAKKRKTAGAEVVTRDGRDEMNLVEFPLAAISERLSPDTKELVVEAPAADGVVRRLTITGSTKYGLPTAKDDEVLVALIQLATLQGFDSPKLYFSRYQIIQVLGWDLGGQSFERVELAINRWVGVTYYWDNAWWDKAAESWVDAKFGILDNAELYDREKWSKRAKAGQVPLPLSWTKWNEVVFKSFQSGYIKHLDMDVYRSLKLPLAKRLYRYLDKHFYRRKTLRFDIQRLAKEKLGLFGRYDNANLRRILEPAVRELEERWDVRAVSREERFVSPRRGVCEVIFERSGKSKLDPEVRQPSLLEAELLARQVSAEVSRELVTQHPAEKVREKIELHDHLVRRQDKRISSNPAGYLVKSIREDYALMPGFETESMRVEKARKLSAKRTRVESQKLAQQELQAARDAEREKPLREYLAKLTPLELMTLEEDAVRGADPFTRNRYAELRAKGGGGLLPALRDAILLNYVEKLLRTPSRVSP